MSRALDFTKPINYFMCLLRSSFDANHLTPHDILVIIKKVIKIARGALKELRVSASVEAGRPYEPVRVIPAKGSGTY